MPENNQKSFLQSATTATARNAASLALFAPVFAGLSFPGTQYVLYLQTAANGQTTFLQHCKQHYRLQGQEIPTHPRFSYLTNNIRPWMLTGGLNRFGLLLPFFVASDLYKDTPYAMPAYAAAIPISGIMQAVPTYRPRVLAMSQLKDKQAKITLKGALLKPAAMRDLLTPWLAVKVWAGGVTFGLYDQLAKPYVQKLFPKWSKFQQDLLSAALAIPVAQAFIVPADTYVARVMNPAMRQLGEQHGITMPPAAPQPKLDLRANARIWAARVVLDRFIATGGLIVAINVFKDLTRGKDDFHSLKAAAQQWLGSIWQSEKPKAEASSTSENSALTVKAPSKQ